MSVLRLNHFCFVFILSDLINEKRNNNILLLLLRKRGFHFRFAIQFLFAQFKF